MLVLHLILTSIAASFVGNIAYARNIGYITDSFLHSTLFSAAICLMIGTDRILVNVCFAVLFSLILELIRWKVRESDAHFSNITVAVSYSFMSLGLLFMPQGNTAVNEYAFGNLDISGIDVIYSLSILIFTFFVSVIIAKNKYPKLHSLLSNIAITITASICIRSVGFFVSAIIIAIPPLSAHIFVKKQTTCIIVSACISLAALAITLTIGRNVHYSVTAITGIVNALFLAGAITYDTLFRRK